MLVWPGLSSRKHEPLTLREAANSDASCPFFLSLSPLVVKAPINLSHQTCGRPRAEILERIKYEGAGLSFENVDHNGTSRRQVFSWHHDIFHIIFHYLDQNAVAATRLLANVDHVPRVGPRPHPLSAMSVAEVVLWQTLHRHPESRKPRVLLNMLVRKRSILIDSAHSLPWDPCHWYLISDLVPHRTNWLGIEYSTRCIMQGSP